MTLEKKCRSGGGSKLKRMTAPLWDDVVQIRGDATESYCFLVMGPPLCDMGAPSVACVVCVGLRPRPKHTRPTHTTKDQHLLLALCACLSRGRAPCVCVCLFTRIRHTRTTLVAKGRTRQGSKAVCCSGTSIFYFFRLAPLQCVHIHKPSPHPCPAAHTHHRLPPTPARRARVARVWRGPCRPWSSRHFVDLVWG